MEVRSKGKMPSKLLGIDNEMELEKQYNVLIIA